MKASATGHARVLSADLLELDAAKLAAIYNIPMSLSYLPPYLNAARIMLVTKLDDPTEPLQYRPLTVTSSIVTRTLHKTAVSQRA